MHRTDWDDGDDRAREFNLAISDWCALFDRVGFDVVGFHELRARAPSPQRRFFATAEWAYDHPGEQVWNLLERV